MKKTLTFIFIAHLFALVSCSANSKEAGTFLAKNEEIKSEQIIKSLEKGENIYVVNSDIVGTLNFTDLQEINTSKGKAIININSAITFINCTFKDDVIANFTKDEKNHTSIFNTNLALIGCIIKGQANFKEAEFKCPVNFSGSEFHGDVFFEGSTFHNKNNYFSEAKFFGKTRFQNTFFYGNINFLRAEFNNITSFQKCAFLNEAQFSSTKFMKKADFGIIKTNGGIYFNYTEFNSNTIFANSFFNNRTEFLNAKFNGTITFNDSHFKGTTRFNEGEVNNSCTFENCIFLLGKPNIDKIKIGENGKLDFTNAKINTLSNFTEKEFINN